MSAPVRVTPALHAPALAPALSTADVEAALNTLDDRFYTYVLAVLLIACGLYFTGSSRTRV